MTFVYHRVYDAAMTIADEAAERLLQDRARAMQDLRATPQFAVLSRIDSAIRELTGRNAPPVSLDTLDDAVAADPGGDHRSVAAAVLEMLEHRDQEWTVHDVLGEFDARGWGFNVADLSRSVRSALWNLVNRDQAVKSGTGRYRAAKFALTSPEAPND